MKNVMRDIHKLINNLNIESMDDFKLVNEICELLSDTDTQKCDGTRVGKSFYVYKHFTVKHDVYTLIN